ncbi:Wadjet anti-phage system protein JetD domain-containing protein, partial [Chlorobium limicola]|uniref:Wadjet anti-phage system protein JetD domain-containing protein n=1 Tax=Chlorobium limicola TaxID=1092 RepID=UPI001F428C59
MVAEFACPVIIRPQTAGSTSRTPFLLMYRKTLIEHRLLWGVEPSPETVELTRLTGEEQALYDDLHSNNLGEKVRLEQE